MSAQSRWIVLTAMRVVLRWGGRSWTMGPPPAEGDGDSAGIAFGSPLTGGRQLGAEPQELVTQAYEAFQREIHTFALHSTRDAEVAADVTQEAFLKLLAEAQAGRVPDNVRAWLYRVTSNIVINRARHLAVVDRVRRAWSGDEEFEDSPEMHSLRAERTALVRAALEHLPRDARVGLLLAANGFSGREIADAIGRTELATRTLICRARMELRERLRMLEGPR